MVTTYELVKKARKTDSHLTLREIGESVGVTRERVRQILNKAGLPTRAIKWNYCPVCGKRTKNRRLRCCSLACFHKLHSIILTCSECGKQFERRMSHFKRAFNNGQRLFHCSKPCKLKHLIALMHASRNITKTKKV